MAKRLFGQTAAILVMLVFGLLGTGAAFAQDPGIRGWVVDSEGEGIDGALVMAPGAQSAVAITNPDGSFGIYVAPGTTLDISCLGYVDRSVPAADKMLVILERDERLSEESKLTAIYTVASKTSVTVSGTVPDGSSAVYAQTANNVGQITSNNTFKLILKGYKGAIITGLSLSMKSNGKAGAGSLSVTCGDAVIASIADSKFSSTNWNGAFTTSYVDIRPAVTPTVVDGDVEIRISGSENSLYCQSVAVTYDATFSIALIPSEDFEVTEGEDAVIVAKAKHAVGPVTYAWTVDGVSMDTEVQLLALDTTTVGGPHEVVCTATDNGAEGATAEASVKYTVKAAPQAYSVTVADGIENGSVAVWNGETQLTSPEEVLEGTVLKVVATPANRSYKVESVTVTGAESGKIALENDEFTMPSENVTVTATFALRTGAAYALVESMDDFEAGVDYLIVAGTDALKNESNGVRIATAQVTIEEGTVETENNSIVWRIALGTSESKYTLYNAAAEVYVASSTTAGMKEGRLVAEGTGEAAQWTIDIDTNSLATIGSMHEGEFLLRNTANPYFAAYKGGTKPSLFKKVGAGVFSISLDPSGEDVVFPEGEEATITATAKNAQGEVTYSWNVTQDDTPGSAEGNVWTIPADAPAGGPWTVYCNATDGTSEDDQWVSFSIEAAPVVYEVTVEQDLEGGRVDVDPTSGVAGTIITVTAAPEDGYRCDGITVNGEPLTGSTFELPEGGAVVSATFVESTTKTATYTVTSVTEVETTGIVPTGSEAVYASTYERTACQLTASNSMTLTLKGYEGAIITGLKLSMHSNSGKGAGSLSAKCGAKTIAGIGVSKFNPGWHSEWTTNYVDVIPPVEPMLVDDDVVITISATENSLYCESFTLEYEPGMSVFGIALDPAEDFEVVQDEEATVKATAKNAAGEVTYAWTVDGVAAETDGPVLALPTGELGEHVVLCLATDTGAEGVTAEASVKYTVVAPPPPPATFAVTVAGGIENGTVALSVAGELLATPAEVLEGTEVTVVATPADGYELGTITLNGELLEETTFTVMGNSEVSATFTKVVDYATLPFLAEDTPYAGPWKKAKVAGLTSDGLDNDYGDGAAKFIASGNWLQIKFVGTPGTLTYNLKGNGTSAECVFTVQASATGGEDEESWTTLATYTGENALPTAKTEFSHELAADSQFVRFVYAAKDKGNVALYDVYISSGSFSVAVDKTGFELEEGTVDTVTAEAKNGTEPYTFAWTSETAELNGEGAELAIPDTLAAGDYAATVTATDADGQTATADVAFTVVEPKVKNTVEIAIGILNGTVEADVAEAAEGDTVTLTATPAPGFKLWSIMVSYGGENLEFTTSPATFVMPAEPVLVGASFVFSNDEIFVPVESEAEFGVGGEYLIVAHKEGSFTDALKNAPSGSRIGVDAVSIETDGYILSDNADIVWKIQAGEEEGQYVLFNEAASVYAAATKNDNVAQLLEEGTNDLAQWTLDLSALPAVKIVSVSYTNRWLQRNTGTAYFATYTGTQTTPMLFKKVESLEFAVSVDKTGFELPLGEGTIVTASAKFGVGDITYVWTSETEELNGAGALLEIPATLAAGAYKATVTAKDSSEPAQTATAEVEFTVAAPLVPYAVTVVEEIPNGTVSSDKAEAVAGETVTLTAEPAEGWKLWRFLLNGEPIEGDSFEMPDAEVTVSAEFRKLHPVTLDQEIANGSIEADKTEAVAGETVTLTAVPDTGWKLETFLLNGEEIGGNSFEMPDRDDVLVSARFAETEKVTYVPVESKDEFAAGEEYLIVAVKADSFTDALLNEAVGTRLGLAGVEIAADESITTDNAGIVWKIQAGAEEGQYTLFNEAASVYAAAKSGGSDAQLLSNGADALAQWTIDFTALPAVKIASVSYPARWLQRNATANNKYFATYGEGQTMPLLYKKAGFSVGFVGKEDGFTVDEGTADSITAAAVRGVEPYSYTWTSETAALNGEGATLAIPDTLAVAEEPYSVTVTAMDSSEPPQVASKTITFSVLPPVVRFEVTVADGIEGGEVTVDKAEAEPGEEVEVTATPDDGNELVSITVSDGDEVLEFASSPATFQMPTSDVTVSATFREVVDYATLPFWAKETPYRGPWQNSEVAGLTHNGLGSDYETETDGVFGAKFRTAGVWMQIKFKGTPGRLTYGIKGNGVSEESGITFRVQESADGATWEDLAVYTSDGELGDDRKDEQFGLSEESRFVRFFLETKTGEGNVGIYDVYISEAGEAEPFVTVSGATTVRVGETFQLVLGLENYSGAHTWTNNVLFGWINPDDSTFYWTVEKIGDYDVTFLAMDGKRVIASTNVTLTIRGNPALVFEGAPEGVVGEPVTFTVVAENTADPTVTFMGFLEVPEGSALTDADVDFDTETGKAIFTPDVTGDYGLAFCAGTGDDYIEDLWPVRVTAPKPKLVFGGDREGTVGKPVTFTVEAVNTADPTVTFDEFVSADYSELEEEDVTFDFPNVSFTPDVPGEYYFSFTAGTKEGGDFVVDVLVITVTDEVPVAPTVTEVEIDVEHGLVTLTFTGTGAEVWGTDDLMEITDQWAPMEAVIEGDTAIVEMNKHFLRVQ